MSNVASSPATVHRPSNSGLDKGRHSVVLSRYIRLLTDLDAKMSVFKSESKVGWENTDQQEKDFDTALVHCPVSEYGSIHSYLNSFFTFFALSISKVLFL